MSSAKQERAETAAAVLEEAETMAQAADKLAKWAAQQLAFAKAEAMSAAHQASVEQIDESEEPSTACCPILKAPLQLKPNHSGPNTAAQEVFATVELLEAILECEVLGMRKLFVFQRVSKRFGATIAGSIRLQKKMFLLPVKETMDEDPQLNPLLDGMEQHLNCFDRVKFIAFPICDSRKVEGYHVAIMVRFYPTQDQHADPRTEWDMQKYLASGNLLSPGSWQKTHITRAGVEISLNMDTKRDWRGGRTLGEFMESLAVVSNWRLADHFRQVIESIKEI
nr:hypothetical protein B0A51_01797 [Rachicladosporium sp. CCFEE 5018]